RPIGQIIAARDWHETPCTVRSSELAEQRGDDSTSYVIRITYDYLYDAQPYTGERYHFGDIASNTSPKWKRRVVADHPAGHRTVCYVNPGDPAEAVLHRGPTRELWWGLFPLPFLAVGIGGVFFGHRLVETKPAGSTSPASSTQGLT